MAEQGGVIGVLALCVGVVLSGAISGCSSSGGSGKVSDTGTTSNGGNGGKTDPTGAGASCEPSPTGCVALGDSCPGGSATCCQTGGTLHVGAGCVGYTTTCVPRCNSSADCDAGSCCIHNPSSLFGGVPVEPGGWCLPNSEVAAVGNQCMTGVGNDTTCQGDYVCGYQCQPASDTSGSGGAGGGSNASCDLPMAQRCASVAAASSITTANYSAQGTVIKFTGDRDTWTSFYYASPGQTNPTLVAGADQVTMQAAILPTSNVSGTSVAAGFYFDNPSCADVSAYRAVAFNVSGNTGGCRLRFSVGQSTDLKVSDDAVRGRCTEATCYGPSALVSASGDVTIALSDLAYGVPCASVEPRGIVGVNWVVQLPADATTSDSCATKLTFSHLRFVQ